MLRLALARLLIAAVPLRRWHAVLGQAGPHRGGTGPADAETSLLARAVVRGAYRLPFATKCLVRAVALHTMLRSRHKPSHLVIAVLDPRQRGQIESLHAWVEAGGEIVIGEVDFSFHPIVQFA
jgi:hypothetical protein